MNETELSILRAELQQLKDERDTARLQTAYGYYVDKAQWDEGWSKGGVPMGAELPNFPPDAPQTVDYGSFPDVYISPYHYPNPVTSKAWTEEQPK